MHTIVVHEKCEKLHRGSGLKSDKQFVVLARMQAHTYTHTFKRENCKYNFNYTAIDVHYNHKMSTNSIACRRISIRCWCASNRACRWKNQFQCIFRFAILQKRNIIVWLTIFIGQKIEFAGFIMRMHQPHIIAIKISVMKPSSIARKMSNVDFVLPSYQNPKEVRWKNDTLFM